MPNETKSSVVRSVRCELNNSLQSKARVDPSIVEGNAQLQLIKQRSDAILKGLDLVLQHHGATSLIRTELDNQLHVYLDTALTEEVWLKRAKFALTYPLSKYLKNPLPPSPDRVFEPAGSLRKWMKARLNAFNRKNTHLWYSWLQAKRSSLPAGEEIISSTYEKHLATLTKVDPGDEDVIDSILSMPIFKRLLKKLSIEVAARLEKGSVFDEYTPSGSACFELPRRRQGQFGRLWEISNDKGYDLGKKEKAIQWNGRFPIPDAFSFSTDLWSMQVRPRVVCGKTVKYNRVTETRAPFGWESWRSLSGTHLHQDIFKASFQNLDCTIQGVLEPFKVRVISKGPALAYYGCKPLQKAMHSSMRKMDCFRLIGRPLSPTDFMDLAKRAEPSDQWFSIDYSAATDGLSWKYSGKILDRVISELPYSQQLLARAVLGPHKLHYPATTGKGVEFRGVMQNGQLMGSILSFPILCLANLGVYLKVTEKVQEGWSDQDRLRHVLVNGDDMVYAAPSALWDDHVTIAGQVGLEMSVGKAYMHPVYANVNSTSVHYDLRRLYSTRRTKYNPYGDNIRTNETPYQIDFLNAGLFFGQHKVQTTDNKTKSLLEPEETWDEEYRLVREKQLHDWDPTEMSWGAYKEFLEMGDSGQGSDQLRVLNGEDPLIWRSSIANYEQFSKLLRKASINTLEHYQNLVSCLNWILKGALPGRKKDLLKQFLSLHKENLKLELLGVRKEGNRLSLFHRNLFLPISLGGMGVEIPPGFKVRKPTKVQKAVAKSCMAKLSKNRLFDLNSQLPLKGYEVTEIEEIQNVPWVRKIAERVTFGSVAKEQFSALRQKNLFGFQAIRSSSSPHYFIQK